MSKITHISGSGIPIYGNDVDTDRIVPARFLKEITFENMGDYLFYDERFESDGSVKSFSLNDKRFKNGSVMVVGTNFGCGSSREHAPQAIARYGIRAIIGDSFAEIFAGNCANLGVVLVSVDEASVADLQSLVEEAPDTVFEIDLEALQVTAGDRSWPIELPKARLSAFLNGTWNTTSLLVSNMDRIRELDGSLPY